MSFIDFQIEVKTLRAFTLGHLKFCICRFLRTETWMNFDFYIIEIIRVLFDVLLLYIWTFRHYKCHHQLEQVIGKVYITWFYLILGRSNLPIKIRLSQKYSSSRDYSDFAVWVIIGHNFCSTPFLTAPIMTQTAKSL